MMVKWELRLSYGKVNKGRRKLLPVEVPVGARKVLHLSQVSLGDSGNTAKRRSVYLYAHVNNKKLLIGKLHSKKLRQLQFDLVFENPFSISHTWKHGSVYFLRYQQDVAKESESESKGDSESQENHQQDVEVNDHVTDANYAEPGKAEEEVHSDSTHESDFEAMLHWPSSAPKAKKRVGNPHPRMPPPTKKAIGASLSTA
nr:hypothetical protein [Tanacetum cinerariifolium]